MAVDVSRLPRIAATLLLGVMITGAGGCSRRSGHPAKKEVPGTGGTVKKTADREADPGKKKQAPAGPVSRDVADVRSHEFLQHVIDAKYDRAFSMMADPMKAAMPAAKLEALWEKILGQVGKYQKQIKTQYKVVKTSHVALITTSFMLGALNITISINDKKQVEGLFFRPANLKRPQTPRPPFPYDQRQVTYDNPADASTLAGTLTLPRGKGPFPAALLITGSGAQDRDETIYGHKPFMVIADRLTRKGIAVLRVDDRGVGGSTGKPDRATIQTHATDVAAGVQFLRKQKEIDGKKIGLIGHSEGGIIAPLVASTSRDIAFIISLAGTGIPGSRLIPMQLEAILAAQPGVTKDARKQIIAAQVKVTGLIEKGAKDDAIAQAIKEAIAINRKVGPDRDKPEPSEAVRAAELKVALGAATAPWVRSFVTLDPGPLWKQVKCPVLVLIGDKDIQVPPGANIPPISAALKSGGARDATFKVLPKLNHLFQTSKTGQVSEYAEIEETFHEPTLTLMTRWLEKRMLR